MIFKPPGKQAKKEAQAISRSHQLLNNNPYKVYDATSAQTVSSMDSETPRQMGAQYICRNLYVAHHGHNLVSSPSNRSISSV